LNFGFRPQSRRPPRRIKHGGCHLPMRRYLRRQLVTLFIVSPVWRRLISLPAGQERHRGTPRS
jgi:hypothetical protein